MVAYDVGLFAIDLEKGIARRVIELFAISYLKDTALQNPRPAPRPMIVLRRSRSWMPNNLYCFNTVASVTNDRAAKLAAIPAGESPANRDAMGRRRGYCIHRR
jgi:hypothetical protein